MGLAKILGKLNPVTYLDDVIKNQVKGKTEIGMATVLKTIDDSLPEIGDLISGEEVTISVEIKIRLKQRGEK